MRSMRGIEKLTWGVLRDVVAMRASHEEIMVGVRGKQITAAEYSEPVWRGNQI